MIRQERTEQELKEFLYQMFLKRIEYKNPTEGMTEAQADVFHEELIKRFNESKKDTKGYVQDVPPQG
jgi:hypothetical protein